MTANPVPIVSVKFEGGMKCTNVASQALLRSLNRRATEAHFPKQLQPPLTPHARAAPKQEKYCVHHTAWHRLASDQLRGLTPGQVTTIRATVVHLLVALHRRRQHHRHWHSQSCWGEPVTEMAMGDPGWPRYFGITQRHGTNCVWWRLWMGKKNNS